MTPSQVFYKKNDLEGHLWLLMSIYDISEELVVTLKYYYEKQKRFSKNHVEIMFAF